VSDKYNIAVVDRKTYAELQERLKNVEAENERLRHELRSVRDVRNEESNHRWKDIERVIAERDALRDEVERLRHEWDVTRNSLKDSRERLKRERAENERLRDVIRSTHSDDRCKVWEGYGRHHPDCLIEELEPEEKP